MGSNLCLERNHNSDQELFGSKHNSDKVLQIHFHSSDYYCKQQKRQKRRKNKKKY